MILGVTDIDGVILGVTLIDTDILGVTDIDTDGVTLIDGVTVLVTLGVGLRYNVFGLDFSYLIPTSRLENPLQNTLRFALIFNFGEAAK